MSAGRLSAHARFALVAVAIGFASPAPAQQPPSATAVTLAKEVIAAKGATNLYETVLPGVVEQAKNMFLQQNPMLGRDLNEVAGRLRTELRSRTAELSEEIARTYASRFSEQELRDVLAFYRTPLGKKVIEEEPKVLEESVKQAQAWAGRLSDEVLNKMRAEMKKKGHDL
jgi:uncharacterized protein